MGFPIDTKTPVAKTVQFSQKTGQRDGRVSQVVVEDAPRDSYSKDSTHADYHAQQLQDQRVKQFVLKNRALGQDVGMKRDANGNLKAQWNSPVPGTKQPTYFASKQHQQDTAEFLIGEAEGARDLAVGTVKGAVQNSPFSQAVRFVKDPVGEVNKKVQGAKNVAEACLNPRKTLENAGNGFHNRYVKPFETGDMRASGNVTGQAIVTATVSRYSVSGVKPGRGGMKSSAQRSGNSGGGRISGSSGSNRPGGTSGASSSTRQSSGAGSASGTSGSGTAVGSQQAKGAGKPKPSKIAVSPALAADIKKFPRKPQQDFGHGISKHGPKDQAAYQDLVANLKPNNKETSWFRTKKDLEHVINSAPDYLPSILNGNPEKALLFREFLDNPKLKGKFGFIVPLAKNAGRGALRKADGTLVKTKNQNSAYIEYAWQQAKGGKWEMRVKTAYPLRK